MIRVSFPYSFRLPTQKQYFVMFFQSISCIFCCYMVYADYLLRKQTNFLWNKSPIWIWPPLLLALKRGLVSRPFGQFYIQWRLSKVYNRAFFNILSGRGIAPLGPTISPTTDQKNAAFAPYVLATVGPFQKINVL